jgi:hypothetical protein
MEQINNHLTTWENQQGLPASWKLPKELTPEDSQLIQKKYASPQIKNLTQPEILARTVEAVTRIHVITGWTIPNDENYMKLLIEEFHTALTDEFPDINFDEVIYAFRKNRTVKDWGKSMNLNLITDVLSGYLSERVQASEKEEHAKKPPQIVYTEEQLDDFHREYVEAFYQRCRKGIKPPVELPDYYKTILVKDGLMTEEIDLHEFFVYWLGRGYEHIYKKIN